MSERDRSSYDNVDVGRERGIDYDPASVATLVELRKIAERLSIEGQLKAASLSEGYLRAKMDDCARSLFSSLASLQSQLERERERPVCGENVSPIPADMVGCGEPIEGMSYRCTHCHVLFHHACAEKHFQSDDVLTEEMVVEIERRAALTSESRDAT